MEDIERKEAGEACRYVPPEWDLRMQMRPVRVLEKHGYWEGVFHRFADINGSTYALIENARGDVRRIDLHYNKLKFLDRGGQRDG